MSAQAARVVSALAGTRKALQLYPETHPVHQEAITTLVDAVNAAAAHDMLVLNLHQGRLYHGSDVLPDDLSGAATVSEALESRGIESLSFDAPFTASDATGLAQVLALKPTPEFDVSAELASRGVTSVAVGILADEGQEQREERDRQRAEDRALYQRVISGLRRVQERFSTGGMVDLTDTTSLVSDMMERLLTDPGAMLGLATIRGAGERGLFHSLNVGIYALVLGHRLGLPDDGLTSLGLSALLHDVGKTAFDASDPNQVTAMRTMHPEVGADILKRVALDDPAPMLVAFEHHMGLDGSGWPAPEDGYVAHPYSRMVAVANRFHNLTDPGDGVEALTPDRAIVQVLREADSSLDPVFARLFAGALGVFPVGCIVRLSDQRVGIVARPGDDPLSPSVRVVWDERGAELDDPQELDLGADGERVRVVEVIDPASLNVAVADKL